MSANGKCYISSSFLSFRGQIGARLAEVMIPLKVISSIQTALVSKTTGFSAPQVSNFQVLPGQGLSDSQGNSGKQHKPNGFVIYTRGGMVHLLFDCRHQQEFYCVLDHVWRNPTPQYRSLSPGAPPCPPRYTRPDFLDQALASQVQARQEAIDFRQRSRDAQSRSQQESGSVSANSDDSVSEGRILPEDQPYGDYYVEAV